MNRSCREVYACENPLPLCAVASALTLLAASSGNPGTPMPVIEDTARLLCDAVNADPSEGGVLRAWIWWVRGGWMLWTRLMC